MDFLWTTYSVSCRGEKSTITTAITGHLLCNHLVVASVTMTTTLSRDLVSLFETVEKY